MERLVLSDAAWERIAPLIIGRPDQKGSTGRDNRMFVEGVLWIVRTGSPWRDLPEAFGPRPCGLFARSRRRLGMGTNRTERSAAYCHLRAAAVLSMQESPSIV